MKKIVFVTLMLADDMLKRHYPVERPLKKVSNFKA